MPSFYLIAGETSGDTHAAEVLRKLKERHPDAALSGLGGPLCQREAPDVEDWLDEAAVLGLWEVLKKYGYFREKMDQAIVHIEKAQPDIVILVDYPGFNLRLAKALRNRGTFRGKIAYYISPQVWAWKRGRIKEMAHTLDLMMCIFPFEKDLYEASGLRTEFVGHPLVDELAEKKEPALVRRENLVGLFPGSRSREIEALFPAMAGAAKQLLEKDASLTFVTVAAQPKLAPRIQQIAKEQGAAVEIAEEDIHTLMQTCSCAVIASGTATLEAACFGLPYCLTYKVAWITGRVARLVMKVDYLGIVNNLAGREVVRELLQEQATAESMAHELGRLLGSPEDRASLSSDLLEIAKGLGGTGAHVAAATSITSLLPSPKAFSREQKPL
ncbi:MAG: lipid-A-disaccharide synthase [Verrucomicrobiota bacterium]